MTLKLKKIIPLRERYKRLKTSHAELLACVAVAAGYLNGSDMLNAVVIRQTLLNAIANAEGL